MSAGRLLCIGDVHGCAPELGRLLDSIALTESDRLVFLGDYVDRGEASAQTIDLLLEVRGAFPETIFLRGNHEDMMLDFLGSGGTGGSIFVRAGGAATLLSYGADPHGRGSLPDELRARMPDDHLRFFSEGLVLSHTSGPWAFVHAGVKPGVPLERQSPQDLLWIREEFLTREHSLRETVLYGHTPVHDVHFSPARRIGMDTGCVYGGRLSALDLTGRLLHQVRRDAPDVTIREVGEEIARTL